MKKANLDTEDYRLSLVKLKSVDSNIFESIVQSKLAGLNLYLRQLVAAVLSKPSQEGLHPSWARGGGVGGKHPQCPKF